MDKDAMLRAFEVLDARAPGSTHLIVGGGAAMILAYDHRLATDDVDAFAAKGSMRLADLDGAAKEVARAIDAQPDWLNAHFESYTGVLPQGYSERLRRVFEGKSLTVDALGPEDLLIMKCFAGRDKDRPHARRLLVLAENLDLVDAHLSLLIERRYPGAQRAADVFDDLREEAGK